MKKNLAKKITLSILAGAVLMSSSVVWAKDVTVTKDEDISKANGWNNLGNGWYLKGDQSGNNISISGVDIPGGKWITAGFTSDGSINNNTINITGGTLQSVYGAEINGGSGDATYNTVMYHLLY